MFQLGSSHTQITMPLAECESTSKPGTFNQTTTKMTAGRKKHFAKCQACSPNPTESRIIVDVTHVAT